MIRFQRARITRISCAALASIFAVLLQAQSASGQG
jgi:hypothetical protein